MDDETQHEDGVDFGLFDVSVVPMEDEGAVLDTPAQTVADPFAPRRTHRAHLLRTGAVWAAVLIVTVGILLVSLHPFLGAPSRPSVATAAPTANVDVGRVYFRGWAPWGQLYIDQGQAITLTSQPVYPAPDGFIWPSFDLAPGRHTIRYAAAYFPTLTCTLSVPEARSDTCPVIHLLSGDRSLLHARRALMLPASPEELPPEVAEDLSSSIQQALDTFALVDIPRDYGVVATGEPIALGEDQTSQAAAVLRAYPRYQLNSDPATATEATSLAPASSCVTLCAADPQLSLYPNESSWPITVNVAVSWEYRSADGARTTLGATPPLAHVRVDLAVARAGDRWQVQVLQQPLCQAASQQARTLTLAPSRPATFLSWTALSFVPAVDGCLLIGYLPNARGGTVAPTALIVSRFGVLLAANPMASALYPQLPRASAAEASRAQAIAGG